MFKPTQLLTTPTEQLGKLSRFVVFQIKLWSHCAKLLRKNRSGQQAAALSYHTLFGLVPLFIVTLWILQLSPNYAEIGQKIRNSVYNYANFSKLTTTIFNEELDREETVFVTDRINEIVDKFFTETHQGSITLISAVIVIWAAIALLSTIEKAFNNIWHVARLRGFLNRIINYWALLTLAPLLIAAGIYLGTKFSPIARLQRGIVSTTGPIIISYIVATVALFLLYFVMPNTKVKAKSAIWGAAVAALVWIAAKTFYVYAVDEFKLYQTVYGAIAIIPITVLWIFITWLIVLFGLQLTFATQHLQSLDAAEIAASRRTEDYFIANDITAINIVREIATAFEKNSAPIEPQVICSKLNLPAEFGDKILNHLVNKNIIARTSDPKVGFVPVKDPANIQLSEIADAIAEVGFAQAPIDQPQTLRQIAQSQRSALGQHNLKQILTPDQ